MRRTLGILVTAVVAARRFRDRPRRDPVAISVSPASTTAAVATLELVDPIDWSGRSIPTRNGVHYGLCDRGPLRPCNLGRGALAARRQAVELAQVAFRDTGVDLVVVGLPQSRTRHVLLVFERDLLAEDLDPSRRPRSGSMRWAASSRTRRPRTASSSSGYDRLPPHVRVA